MEMRRTVYIAYMAEMRNAYKILVGKIKGKRPLGILQRRWEKG
jgi:hypothetical protein